MPDLRADSWQIEPKSASVSASQYCNNEIDDSDRFQLVQTPQTLPATAKPIHPIES